MNEESKVLDDDPVIKEVPVYMCRSLPGKLNVAKFPYQVKTGVAREKTVSLGRIKHEANIIELDCNLDPTSDFTNADKLETYAECNKSSSRLRYKFPVRGTSCTSEKELKQYVFMIMVQEKVYLVQAGDSYLFFPNFKSSDKSDTTKSTKKSNKSPVEGNGEEENKVIKEPVTAVTVKFSQDNSSKTQTSHEMHSITKYFEKLNQEPWIDLKYFSSYNPYSMKIIERLYTNKHPGKEISFSLKPKQFVKLLFPAYHEKDVPFGLFKPRTLEDSNEEVIDL